MSTRTRTSAGLLLALLALVGVATVTSSVPASGQTAPPPQFYTFPGYAVAGTGGVWTLDAYGYDWAPNSDVVVQFASDQPVTFRTGPNGSFSQVPWNVPRRGPGFYTITATQGRLGTTFRFRVTSIVLDPPCHSPGTRSLSVSGTNWSPRNVNSPEAGVWVYYDFNDWTYSQERFAPTDASGSFVTSPPFAVDPPDGATMPIHVMDSFEDEGEVAWAPCPPPTTTTSTTIATTTTRPGTTSTVSTTTTTSTTIPIPPPTPGVTLVIEPALGPPGFVALARGTGWLPGPVQVVWSRGLGAFTATAGADGSFVQQVLVFPRDVVGPRSLLATNGTQSAAAPFLVVPQTVQPSGKDVTSINRIRRFIQRSG